MKKILAVLGLALLGAAAAFPAGTAVSLQNQEDSWFYFVVDPPDLAGLPPGSPLVTSRVAAFFAKESDQFPFTAVKPRAGLTLEALPEGTHFLVGFFADAGKSVFPVRVLTLQVDNRLGQRFYGVYSEPPLMTVPRDAGILAKFPAPEAETAAVPEQAEAAKTSGGQALSAAQAQGRPNQIASFAVGFTPAVFSREVNGDFSVLPISESHYWNREGTRISSLSGFRSGGSIVIDVALATRLSPEVSYFLYFFGARRAERDNRVTLEVKPLAEDGGPGAAALWTAGDPEPRPVGTVSVSGDSFRVAIENSDLPARLFAESGGNPSVDLTASYFDRSQATYEEFSYTTFSLADLPVLTR